MDYTGIPTSQLDVASMAKKDDLLVGSQDGKSRNFKVEDIRGINDNKKSNKTTYSSEKIEKLISSLTNLSDEDITALSNAITELRNTVTSNKEDSDTQFNNRYIKTETYSRGEVNQKIADLVNSAPGTLDTLKEIADALGNDPNFSTTIINLLGNKVDKEEGKVLSTNDYTDEEKQKLECKTNYDLINGSLRIGQRYDANNSATFTNPSNKYIMDRFLCNGTGTVVPIQGGGCAVTGTINFKYWMEKLDFDLLPSKFNITYSVNGVETVLEVIKADCTIDTDGNGLIFNQDITDSVLNYVHYGKRPFMPREYVEELHACKRYYQQILALGIVINYNINLPTTFPVSMRIAPTVTIYDGYYRVVSDVYKNKINILGTGSVDVSPKSNTATKNLISTISCNNLIASSSNAFVLLVLDSEIHN